MREKEMQKTSLFTLFLFILIIVIIVMVVYIYINKAKSDNEIKSLETSIVNMQTTINELQNQNNSESNSSVSVSNQSTSESIINMSTELAYGILNKYKSENLPNANWYIGKIKLIAHGDNNTYWVSYEECNLDGYKETVGAIIEYKDGKWLTNLPGFSGISDETANKYNFVNYTNENLDELNKTMNIELAWGILTKYKAENLPDDAKWYITDVKLVAHGDNNTYWVSYEDYNLDGYTENAGTIIEYKDGKWSTDLPGFSRISNETMSKYNFVNY